MVFPVYAVVTSVNSVRSPQPDHSFFLRIGPQEDDVACRIAIGKGQTNDFAIEAFGNLCVCDWKMSLVEVHANAVRPGSRLHLVSMTFRVVFVRLAVFLIPGRLVRAV